MKTSRIFLGTTMVIVLLWTLTPFVIPRLTTDDVGKFGDMFGATNALFSGLALVGAVYAILLQREELLEQRREFERQTEQFRLQNELLSKQIEAAESQARAAAIRETLATLPFFRFRSGSFNLDTEGFKFTNVGSDVFQTTFYVEGGREYHVKHTHEEAWRRDEIAEVTIRAPEGRNLRPYTLVIGYTTLLGERRFTRYHCQGNGSRPKDTNKA